MSSGKNWPVYKQKVKGNTENPAIWGFSQLESLHDSRTQTLIDNCKGFEQQRPFIFSVKQSDSVLEQKSE